MTLLRGSPNRVGTDIVLDPGQQYARSRTRTGASVTLGNVGFGGPTPWQASRLISGGHDGREDAPQAQ
ncbi:MAG: hypothetical protein AB1758_09875 [Candidatus Eremiobacterota bacterium]